MGPSRGYLVVGDGSERTERDTLHCAHCNAAVLVHPGRAPSQGGGWCMNCDAVICEACARRGRCTPFEARLEAAEARGRTRRSIDALLVLALLLVAACAPSDGPAVASVTQALDGGGCIVCPEGATGPEGHTGITGADGAMGATGATGATGPQGMAGAAGAPGTPGQRGPTGPRGLPGLRGATGPVGAAGVKGPAGAVGDTGPTGPRGICTCDGIAEGTGGSRRLYPVAGKAATSVAIAAGHCLPSQEIDAPGNVANVKAYAASWGRQIPGVSVEVHQSDAVPSGWAVTICYEPPSPPTVTLQVLVEEVQ